MTISDEDWDRIREQIEASVHETLEPNELLTGWVLIASMMTDDRIHNCVALTMKDQSAVSSMGILKFGLIEEEEAVRRNYGND